MVDDHHHNQQKAVVVCCMCGDVGFSEKLFRCNKCRHRFQHSYCSNYYSQFSEPIEQCDWCQSEETRNNNARGTSSSSSSSRKSSARGSSQEGGNRSHYSGLKIKQHVDREDADQTRPPPPSPAVGRNHGGLPSPKPSTRRYKLLKDVMC